MTEHYLSTGDIAKQLGITQGAMGHYKLPEPDVIIGNRYKGWSQETVDAWIASRPGRGTRTDLTNQQRNMR